MATLIRRSDKGCRRKGSLPQDSSPVAPGMAVDDMEAMAAAWIEDGRARLLSSSTRQPRGVLAGKLVWWLRREGHSVCGKEELRGFFGYLATAHESERGRWDGGDLK